MRVRMLEQMPVTVDGVNRVDAEAGDELLMGDGVAADLIEAGKAESLDAGDPDASAKPKRSRKKTADKDAGDADENKDAGDADENGDASDES